MKRLLVIAVLASGCAPHLPTQPDIVTPAVQTAPAAIRLTLASRPDRTYDVTATVLTADGHFVKDVPLAFKMDSGTVTPDTATTNGNGMAQAVASTASTTTLTVSGGALTASTRVDAMPGPVVITPTPPPPPTPLPPPSISLQPITTTVGVSTLFNVGAFVNGGIQVASTVWAFGDGGTFASANTGASHTYTTVGTYTASVTATDAIGRRASASAIVTVQVGALLATMTSTPAATTVGGTLTFAVNVAQLGPAETVTAYQWDLDGDGVYESITAAASRASAPYLVVGVFTAKVLATTSAGRSVVASVGFAIRN